MQIKNIIKYCLLFVVLSSVLGFVSCGGGGGGGDSAFSIRYDGNGATSGTIPARQNSDDGSSLVVSGNTGSLKINGYTFDCWNTSADGSGVDYAEGSSYKGESITLYAKWAPIFITSSSHNTPSMSDNIHYSPGNSFLTIIGVTAKGKQLSEIEVPNTIDDIEVISIGAGAFTNCTNMVRLTIAESIVSIGTNVFPGCFQLKSIEFKSPTPPSIGAGAFDDCEARLLVSFVYIDTYKGASGWIGYASRIVVPEAEIFTYSIINNCVTITGLTDYGRGRTTLIIPESIEKYPVTGIGDSAFVGCTGFTGTLTIPSNITNIGKYAFSGCIGFTGLTIKNGVEYIGRGAFYGCSGFTGNLTIPSSVKGIGSRHGDDVDYYYNFDGGVFQNCIGFTSLTIKEGAKEIGVSAFAGCTGFIGALAIPSGVTLIDVSAFEGCTGFTGELTIPSSVTRIEWKAFYGCSSFTSARFENTTPPTLNGDAFTGWNYNNFVIFVPDSAVNVYKTAPYWSEFYSYYIESSSYIPQEIFTYSTISNCVTITGLTDYGMGRRVLIIPETINGYPVTGIGNNSFYGHTFVGNLTIPSSVTSIGDYAFYNGDSYGTLTISNGVTSIGDYAFYQCGHFEGDLIIPSSVTSIGALAFYYCTGFNSIRVENTTPPTIENTSFQDCTCNIYVPSSAVATYKAAPGWSNYSARIFGY